MKKGWITLKLRHLLEAIQKFVVFDNIPEELKEQRCNWCFQQFKKGYSRFSVHLQERYKV